MFLLSVYGTTADAGNLSRCQQKTCALFRYYHLLEGVGLETPITAGAMRILKTLVTSEQDLKVRASRGRNTSRSNVSGGWALEGWFALTQWHEDTIVTVDFLTPHRRQTVRLLVSSREWPHPVLQPGCDTRFVSVMRATRVPEIQLKANHLHLFTANKNTKSAFNSRDSCVVPQEGASCITSGVI